MLFNPRLKYFAMPRDQLGFEDPVKPLWRLREVSEEIPSAKGERNTGNKTPRVHT